MTKTKSYTSQLVDFVLDLKFEQLPARVVSETRFNVMDAIGNALASIKKGDDTGRIIATIGEETDGKREARIIGSLVPVPLLSAVFANSGFVRGLGFDDFHLRSAAHLNGPLFPAAMATAEFVKASGKEFITTLAAAYNVGARVAMAAGPEYLLDRNLDPTSFGGIFAAAAATGRLLQLNKEQMAMAFGLAAAQASGIFGIKGGHNGFYFQQAKASQSGALSAILAKRGMTGLSDVFDDERGFFGAFSAQPNRDALTDGLWDHFEIARTAYKAYPCEIFVAPGIEILLDILKKQDISSQDVESIELKLPTHVAFMASIPGFPQRRFAARLSGRYIMSYTLLIRDEMLFNLEPFFDEGMKDPRLPGLVERVNIVADHAMDDPDPNNYGNVLTLKTKSGQSYSGEKRAFKGNPKDPFTKEEYEAKFHKIAAYTINRNKADEIIDGIESLDKISDISALMDLLKI